MPPLKAPRTALAHTLALAAITCVSAHHALRLHAHTWVGMFKVRIMLIKALVATWEQSILPSADCHGCRSKA